MKAFQEFLTYLIYSALWRIVRLLPERTAYKFFERIAERAYRKNGKRIARLRENYRQVLPLLENDELEALVRSGVSSAMRYWCDTFRISDWSQERVAATVTTENNELFLDSVKSGKGVIIALPHAGNWDHAGLYYCSQGIKVHTVAEHLRPERLFRRFLAHRERMGMKVLDLEEKVTDQLINFLQEGKLVALVADRDLSRSGVDVIGKNPPPLDLATPEGRQRAMQDVLRALGKGYTKDYEIMIRQYFERLQRVQGGLR